MTTFGSQFVVQYVCNKKIRQKFDTVDMVRDITRTSSKKKKTNKFDKRRVNV